MPDVTIQVSGVREARGLIIVGLYRDAGFKRFGGEPMLRLQVPAVEGAVSLVFHDVEPAAWAAGAYHDENGNGHLDLTMVGTPSEGRGYSVVERVGLRAPTFAEACFEVFERDVVQPIELRYPA